MTPELRNKLLKAWNRNKSTVGLAPEWEDFENFFQWAIVNGVGLNSKLLKVDMKQPFGPGNIKITTFTVAERAAQHASQAPMPSREQSWNVAVLSFRRALAQASEQAKLKLVERITTGSMPPEWNNYLDY